MQNWDRRVIRKCRKTNPPKKKKLFTYKKKENRNDFRQFKKPVSMSDWVEPKNEEKAGMGKERGKGGQGNSKVEDNGWHIPFAFGRFQQQEIAFFQNGGHHEYFSHYLQRANRQLEGGGEGNWHCFFFVFISIMYIILFMEIFYQPSIFPEAVVFTVNDHFELCSYLKLFYVTFESNLRPPSWLIEEIKMANKLLVFRNCFLFWENKICFKFSNSSKCCLRSPTGLNLFWFCFGWK